ncbi:MAG: peptide ABC transporter [Candidatus Rokuibacteriota bacterium]|nr:MAG: peptide ABC transporter [Candidatus Rokubacteria bacterium]
MARYVARRLLLLLPAWLIMGSLAFALIRLIPGDPAAVLLGMEATPQAVADLRARLGLDRPLPVQFALWLSRVLEGELGHSFFLGQPVLQAILGRLPVTLSLTVAALTCAVLIGVPVGLRAATRPNSPTDLGTMAAAVVGLSIPDFALGLGLIFLFAVALPWLPVGGYIPLSRSAGGYLAHLALPAFALGVSQAALIARITRSSMLETLTGDYIRTARAKGLTVVGNAAVVLLGGAFVVETVFNLPGLGNLVVMAVKRRDYPLVQGCLLLISTVVIVVNLAVDVLYAYVDPRIRYG